MRTPAPRPHFAKILPALLVGLFLLAAGARAPAQAAPVSVLGIWDDADEAAAGRPYAHVDTDAPKGGRLRLSAVGTFDSFNPFSPRGVPAAQLALTYETLGVTPPGSRDFIIRGLLAESFDLAPDRLSMVVKLRPEARFADDVPVTAHDVVFSFNALVTQASPVYRNYYEHVTGVEALGEKEVRFTFAAADNRELPLIICQMPVLPAHWWKGRNLGEPQNEAMPGSGPYRLAHSVMGQRLVYVLRRNWWGANLPVNAGRYNFNSLQVDYYRDFSVAREAFFAGEADFYSERNIKDWMNAYNVPAVRDGRILRHTAESQAIQGFGGIFMNTRRPLLADARVRRALLLLFDFKWLNDAFFYNEYTRYSSFFTNAPFAAKPLPAEGELALLQGLKNTPQPHILGPLPQIPAGGRNTERDRMREALHLFTEAGWEIRDGRMTSADGRHFELTLLSNSPTMQRVYMPYRSILSRLGITLNIRLVDQAQYISRVRSFDYDLVQAVVRQSSNPGNEQRNYWSSSAAKARGSRNYAGISDPLVDEVIERLIASPSRETLHSAAALLDRLLQHGTYAVPTWYSSRMRFSWWRQRIRPPRNFDAASGLDIMSWYRATENAPESVPGNAAAAPGEK